MWNIFKEYSEYLKDNPEGYWFKRKLYGWGWTPATWQGWVAMLVAVGIFALGIYIGDTDDAPGAALLGLIIMLAIIFGVACWKGEKPKWMWGLPRDKN